MERMDTEEIKAKLNSSVEVSTIRKWMAAYILLLPLCCLAHYFTVRSIPFPINPLVFYPVVGLSALIPLLAVQLVKLWRIFRCPESYLFYRVRLTEIHSKWKNHAYYFTVALEVPGGIQRVNTHPIFQTWGPINPLIKDYVNLHATIAYNEETHEVVVIQ